MTGQTIYRFERFFEALLIGQTIFRLERFFRSRFWLGKEKKKKRFIQSHRIGETKNAFLVKNVQRKGKKTKRNENEAEKKLKRVLGQIKRRYHCTHLHNFIHLTRDMIMILHALLSTCYFCSNFNDR